jgi:hypothetical protein
MAEFVTATIEREEGLRHAVDLVVVFAIGKGGGLGDEVLAPRCVLQCKRR